MCLGSWWPNFPRRLHPGRGFSHAQTRETTVGQLNFCIKETWHLCGFLSIHPWWLQTSTVIVCLKKVRYWHACRKQEMMAKGKVSGMLYINLYQKNLTWNNMKQQQLSSHNLPDVFDTVVFHVGDESRLWNFMWLELLRKVNCTNFTGNCQSNVSVSVMYQNISTKRQKKYNYIIGNYYNYLYT